MTSALHDPSPENVAAAPAVAVTGELARLAEPSAISELVAGWRVLLGCILGIAVGVAVMPSAAIAVFMPSFQHDFGWSRTAVSAGPSMLGGMLMLSSPVIGWLSDRMAEARIIAVSMLAMGLSFLLFSRMGGDVRFFLGGFALMAIVSSGTSTIPFARIVNANFDRSRGMALGLAMTGAGLTGLILPSTLVPFVAGHGWRAGCVALALIIIVSAPTVFLLLRGARRAEAAGDKPSMPGAGIALKEAAAGRVFWQMAVAFLMIPLATVGIAIHFIALLNDAGLSPARAGAIAGLTGLVTIVVRLVTGFLLDRLFAPFVAAAMMAAAALCIGLLGIFGASVAPLGALAYGLAVGAEIDVIGYLVSRYFGMRAYGRIYGMLYAAVLLGATTSALGYGLIFDRFGSYRPALLGAAALLAIAALLLARLPRFPLLGRSE